MIKYLGLDLDGTLLDSEKKITERTQKRILQYKKNGVGVILASGRHCFEIMKYAEELCFMEKDYIICCDGQYIVDSKGNLLWENEYLAWKDVEKFIKSGHYTSFLIFTENEKYEIDTRPFYRIGKKVIRTIKKQNNMLVLNWNDGKKRNIGKIQKMVFYENNLSETKFCKNPQYTIHFLKEGKIEILHKNVSKMKGMEYLFKILGITENEVLYFGDDENDRECFEGLKNCIAMENTPDELKQRAIYVTADSDHDGVGVALEKFMSGEILLND